VIGKQVREAGDMREDAVEIAIQCLTFISEDMDRLGKFLALSGAGPENIRESAQDLTFLGGVLDFMLLDEAMLVEFAAWADMDPSAPAAARRFLPGSAPD
jgi:hypothetical protein